MSTMQQVTEKRSARMITTGALGEGFVSIGAIVLSIIGLAGKFPALMLPIATMAIGASLLFEGGAITARFSNMFSLARVPVDVSEFGLGITAEFATGIAGIALGVLALIGLQPFVLTPIAAIIYGASVLLGAGATARANSLMSQVSEQREVVREVMREAVSAASGMQVLVGLGAVTLGILALVGINPMVLSMIAMLSLGFAVLLGETAIINRVTGAARRKSITA